MQGPKELQVMGRHARMRGPSGALGRPLEAVSLQHMMVMIEAATNITDCKEEATMVEITS